MAILKMLSGFMLLSVMVSCSTTQNSATQTDPAGMAVGWQKKHENQLSDSTKMIVMPSVSIQGGIRGGSQKASALPHIRIYKTNGDYFRQVPVTLNQSRTEIISYPAPSDLLDSRPVKLDKGFLLDNRGIGVNTAFTRWTYDEYEALPSAPSPEEIMSNLIPDSRVTEIYEMPFTIGTSDAAALCDSLIAKGLPGCTPLIRYMNISTP